MRISLLLRASATLLVLFGCSNGTVPNPFYQEPPVTPATPAAVPPVAEGGVDATPTPLSGAQLVLTLGCPHCHSSAAGELAGSNDPVAGTQAYPANLTPDHETGIGDWTDDDITRAIRTGYDDQKEELCPTMPRFTGLTDDQVRAIIGYLRQLPAVNHAVNESICPPTKTGDDDAGDGQDASPQDSAPPPPPECAGYAAPDVPAPCFTLKETQKNGCYGGYFCYLPTSRCVPPPPGC
jgi:hypothetical protein